jgi:hypothetical protein
MNCGHVSEVLFYRYEAGLTEELFPPRLFHFVLALIVKADVVLSIL